MPVRAGKACTDLVERANVQSGNKPCAMIRTVLYQKLITYFGVFFIGVRGLPAYDALNLPFLGG